MIWWLRRIGAAGVVAGLVVGGSHVATAQVSAPTGTAHPTHLSISVSVRWVTFGERVTTTTRLTDQATGMPIPGAHVLLTWRETDFFHVVPRTTSETGTASVTFRPYDNTGVSWSFAGSATAAPSNSDGRAIHVRQTVSIHSPAEAKGARRGQQILVWGTVRPGYYGMVVVEPPPVHYAYIQWHNQLGWHAQLRVKMLRQRMPNGKVQYGYVTRFVPSSRHLRALVPATQFNARGVSRTLYIPAAAP